MEKKTYSKVCRLGKKHSFTDIPICPTLVLVSWRWANKVAQAEWFKKTTQKFIIWQFWWLQIPGYKVMLQARPCSLGDSGYNPSFPH